MKKILTASLVAMMAVSAANADIASTQYVTSKTGNLEFTGTLSNKNLTQAISTLQTEMGSISGVEGGVVSGEQLDEAITGVTDKIGTVAQGETVVSMITGALDDAKEYADGLGVKYDAAGAAATAKSEAIAAAAEDATTKANKALTDAQSYADQAELDAIDAAKTYADGLGVKYDAAGAAATAKSEAIAAAAEDATTKANKALTDAKSDAANTYQVKSSKMSIGGANGTWTDLTTADGYSATGTHSLVLKDGVISWEAVVNQ